MTQPIKVTTRQTEELIRKCARTDKKTRILNIVVLICWAVICVIRIILGILFPDDWMNWVLVALTAILVFLYIAIIVDPTLFHPTMTTTLTLFDQSASISMDKYGKTRGYSVDWRKVYIQETADYYIYLVNFRRMQIFRKEDLTDCTPEEFSSFLRAKIGARYVVKNQ